MTAAFTMTRFYKLFFYLVLFVSYFSLASSVVANSTEQQLVESTHIKVITSGGFAAAFALLAPKFEQEFGLKIITSHGSSSGGAYDSIPMRLARGEYYDIIILSRPSLDQLTELGYVISASRTDLVYSDIGMAVKAGSAIPDISSPGAFIDTLLKAKSIGYSASASGTYLSTILWPGVGVWPQIADKSQRILSERVASVVARGEVEIGFQQSSEIIPIAGAVYVGPIPRSLQKITTFSAGILHQAKNVEYAKQLITYLSSQEVAPIIATTGLLPVVLEIPTAVSKK